MSLPILSLIATYSHHEMLTISMIAEQYLQYKYMSK